MDLLKQAIKAILDVKVPDGAGPAYRTTLCILMLEVYYRYMPSTKS